MKFWVICLMGNFIIYLNINVRDDKRIKYKCKIFFLSVDLIEKIGVVEYF